MPGFRPNIRFLVAHPRLAVSLAAAAATATVIVAGAPGASAATVAGGQASQGGTLSVSSLIAGKVKPHKPAAPAKPAAAGQQEFTFYDSITPSEIPAHEQMATYADGDYAVDRSQVSDPDQVIWIDTDGHDANADALDVEPGDATPSEVAGWVQRRLSTHPGAVAIVYTMRSDWAAAKASVATLPASMQAQVRWWIADPTGHPHIVPGAQATQWYWGQNYDINTAEPGF